MAGWTPQVGSMLMLILTTLLGTPSSLPLPTLHLLQQQHNDGDEAGSTLLQRDQRPGRADEQLAVAKGHVPLQPVLLQEGAHGCLVRAQQVVGPRVLTGHFVPASTGEGSGDLPSGGGGEAHRVMAHCLYLSKNRG
jgi:hypothetical protein